MPRLRNAAGVVVGVREGKTVPGFSPVGDDDGGRVEDYSTRTVVDLRAEIGRRNEGRDGSDRIPSEGKKADLVAALQADDGK